MSKDVIDNVQAQDFTVIAANDIENACNSGCRSIVGTEIQYLDRCIMIMPSNGDERRGPEISCTKPKLPLSNPSDANRRVNAAQVVPAAKSPAPPGAPADRTISRRISPSTSSEWKDVAWTFIVTVMGTYAVYLLRENRRLELENRKRQAKIIHMRNREEEKLESFKNRDQALQGQLRCASSDMTKWESRCTEAITINKELDEHLKLSRAENDRVRLESSKSSEEVKKLYAEVDEERKRGRENSGLKMENEVAARQMEVESLQHSNNTLQEQLKHCQVNLRHQTDAREKAGKEVTELKVKLSTSTSEVNRSKKELSSCKRRLSDLNEDVARLSAEADTQRGIHRDLESELEQTNASLTQTRKALDVSESNCKLEAEKRKDVDARLKEATRNGRR
ncbi:hypothetical protein VNI00_000160 [Paramarasmius palmivorus]|uniref:Uncharacterized protein n=1 Tax=Paramarasmius palmivorus TaxID=297713 RepID=A0AAW0EGI1_9AGAR